MGDDTKTAYEIYANNQEFFDYLEFALKLPEYKGKDLFWVLKNGSEMHERKNKDEGTPMFSRLRKRIL